MTIIKDCETFKIIQNCQVIYSLHSHTLNINTYLKETTYALSFKDGSIFLRESCSWTALPSDPFLKISMPAAFHKKGNYCRLHFSV